MREASRKTRKRFVFVAAVLAGVLGFSSVAFACITQKGKLTVTGATAGDTVIGNGTDMGWCQKATNAARQTPGNDVTYTIRPGASGDCSTSSLADGTGYEVRVYHPTESEGYAYIKDSTTGLWEFQDGTGCYKTSPARGTRQGSTFSITNGAADVTRTLDVGGLTHENGTNNAALVCVAKATNPTAGGIFSPLRVAST